MNTIPQPFSATHFSTLQLLQKFYKNCCQSLDKANKKKNAKPGSGRVTELGYKNYGTEKAVVEKKRGALNLE